MSYNLLDLRSRVRTKISDTSYSASTIDGYINDAIDEIADLYPWVYFQKLVSGSLTIGEYTYDQQTDHQSTTKLVMLQPDLTGYLDITKYRLTSDAFFDTYPAPDQLTSAQPLYWTEYGGQIYFHCPADKAYVLRQFYQKIPTEVSADAAVPELPQNFREAIVLGASYRCEEERENYDMAMMIQNRFASKTAALISRFANDTLAGPDTVVMPGQRSFDPWRDK